MNKEWLFFRDDEAVAWEGTPRLSAAIGGVTVGAIIVGGCLVAAITIDLRLLVGSVIGIGIIAWQFLRVRHTSYIVTTRAVWLKRGVLKKTVRRVGLPQIQNTAYSQSLTGSIFGYGTVSVEVAGGPDVAFRRIDEPEGVRRIITNQIGDDETEIPGTIDQWNKVLALARELKTAVEK